MIHLVQFAAFAQRIGQLHARLDSKLRIYRAKVGPHGINGYAKRPGSRLVGVAIGDQIRHSSFGLGE